MESFYFDNNPSISIENMRYKMRFLCNPNGGRFDGSIFSKCVSFGHCGIVFCDIYEKKAIKLYMNNCPYKYKMSIDMFNNFVNYNIPNIVTLHNYFHFEESSSKVIDAYTMDFIGGDVVSLLSLDNNEFLNLMNMFEETIMALSEKKILINDLNNDNVLIFKDKLFLIDLDCYCDTVLPSRFVYSHNKNEVIKCINSILFVQFKNLRGVSRFTFVENIHFKSFFQCVEVALRGDSPDEFCKRLVLGGRNTKI